MLLCNEYRVQGLSVENTAHLLTSKGVVDVAGTLVHGLIGDLGALSRTFKHPREDRNTRAECNDEAEKRKVVLFPLCPSLS